MLERRRFLSGLATLPLVGGAVALIGRPTAAAVPVSDALLERYVGFLAHEHRAALTELLLRTTPSPDARLRIGKGQIPLHWMPDDPAAATLCSAPASGRAAVILSAAGLPIGRLANS